MFLHRKLNPAYLVLFVFVGWCSPASAQTLEETLLYAYQHSPQLRAALARRNATATQVGQARANFLPSISAGAQYARSRVDNQGFFNQDESQKPRAGRLTITQPIFNGFADVAQFKRAQYMRDAANQEHEAQKQNVLFAAASAFFDLLRGKDLLDISRRSEGFFIEQLESARDRFEVGELTFTDVAQAEARLAQAKAETTRSTGNYTIARARYYDVVGMDAPFEPETPKFKFRLPKSLDKALESARKNHPMLKMSIYDHNAAEQAVNAAIGRLLPSVEVEGVGQRAFDTIRKGSRSESLQVTANVSIPIWRGGAAFNRLEEIRQNEHAQKYTIVQLRRTIDQNAKIAWQRLKTTEAEITSYKAQIQANRIALDGVREESAVGDRTVLDVLDAENELFQSLQRLIQAQSDYRKAVFQLLRDTGTLTLDTLNIARPNQTNP